MLTLEQLLDPISTELFFKEYWQQCPLHLSNRMRSLYDLLFSLKDVEHILLQIPLDSLDELLLVKEGDRYPLSQLIQSDKIDKKKLFEAFFQGYTIIMNKMSRYRQSLATFCKYMETIFQSYVEFHHSINANMYLTPKNSMGLALHFDRHNIFTLQLEGKKRWRLYQPFQEMLGQVVEVGCFEPPQLLMEIQLEEGDLLYIPEGFIHEATSAPDNFSLHLSIGIYVVPWQDVMQHMLLDIQQEVRG